MAKTYSKSEIEEMFKTAIKKPNTFYQHDFINYTGTLKDDGNTSYTEYISGLLLQNDNYKVFDDIQKITREKSYRTENHFKNFKINYESNREEEKIAKFFFRFQKNNNSFGKIIDFQTPLKDTNDNKVGKIDLLAYDESSKIARIFELKKPESDETLLRCILESFTYSKIIDSEKLKEDFKEEGLADCCKIIPCPLIFKNSQPYKDFEKSKKNGHSNIKRLLSAFQEEVFVIRETTPERFFLANQEKY